MPVRVEFLARARTGQNGLKIRLYTIWDEDRVGDVNPPASQIDDLGDSSCVFNLNRFFGNGCFLEARAIGESVEAVDAFRTYVMRGGYDQGPAPFPGASWLTQSGDESYPGEFPFVFLCLTPDPALSEIVVPPKPELYRPDFEQFMQRRRRAKSLSQYLAFIIPTLAGDDGNGGGDSAFWSCAMTRYPRLTKYINCGNSLN